MIESSNVKMCEKRAAPNVVLLFAQEEEFVVSPLEDTSGVLGAGLGEEARSQEDGRVLRPVHQDLQS